MPVSESYVIQYLLRETESRAGGVDWAETESSGFQAFFNEVRVLMYSVPSTSGPRLCLEFGWVHDRVYIQEPCKVAIFGRPYRNDEEEQVAVLLHRLYGAIGAQIQRRHEAAVAMEREIREAIFRRLLFGPQTGAGLDAGS